MGRPAVFLAYGLLIAAAAGIGAALWGYAQYTRPGPLAAPRVVVIAKGQGLAAIAETLAAAGVVRSSRIFRAGARVSGAARRLQAGEYRFPERASPRDVVGILESGRIVTRRLTFAEGLTVRQILDRLAVSDGLVGEVAAAPAEGSLLPETYHFSFGETRTAMIARMQKAMTDTLDALWPDRRSDLPYGTKREAVVLASLVQREAASEAEMPLIAGVFANRLRLGMRLQSDPTVAYDIAPDGLDRPLRRADLEKPGPYNTYQIDGLPPGPICNPGRAALQAALNPAETDFLYFVVNGAGRHAFAENLKSHNRNVRRWRQVRRDASGTTRR